MKQSGWQRLRDYVDSLKPLASLVLEGGSGTVRQPEGPFARLLRPGAPPREETIRCSGDLVVPADGDRVLVLQTQEPLARNWAFDLHLSGSNSVDGPWALEAPELIVRVTGKSGSENWILAEPLNKPVVVLYGAPRPFGKARALVNNLDIHEEPPMVQAGPVQVRFFTRPERTLIRDLLDVGLMRTASLMECEFECWDDASLPEIVQFCAEIGSLCTYANGHHNGAPVVTLFDRSGRIAARCSGAPIDTAGGSQPLLLSGHTPRAFQQLFRECFDEHQRMQRSALPWRRLPSYCASLEDGSYLEQKCAAVMTALEFFVRTSLRETDPGNWEQYRAMTLPQLIGSARRVLGWDVPKHYVAKDLYRLLRNAVAHGGDLPTKDNTELRLMFDKWRLFLFRRVLMRLGYTGRIYSPEKGWASSSDIADFSEEHNTFQTGEN